MKAKKEVTTYILPAYLASYLINNDGSGLTDQEVNEINTWHENVNPGACVGCSDESFFTWRNDLNNLGADCLEYQFIKY